MPAALEHTDHQLRYNTFQEPTVCAHCKKLLKGAFWQGYKCDRRGSCTLCCTRVLYLVFSCCRLRAGLPQDVHRVGCAVPHALEAEQLQLRVVQPAPSALQFVRSHSS